MRYLGDHQLHLSGDTSLTASLWQIRLFGSLEISTPTGTVVCVTRKKTGELLAFLALNPNRPHTRDILIETIWGDSDIIDARTRLRQEIMRLKALFETCGASSSPLLISRETCQLQPGTLVDVSAFEQACWQGARDTDSMRKCIAYGEAAALYGADLLTGYGAQWIVAQRSRLSQCYERALFDMAETQRQLGDYSNAEQALSKLLSHNPLSEECHVALMRLYSELGQPARVQQQFRSMENALREGLGVGPTPGSNKLAAELRETAGQRIATGSQHVIAPQIEPVHADAPTPSASSEQIRLRQGSPASHERATVTRTAARQFAAALCLILLIGSAVSMSISRRKPHNTVALTAAPVVRNREQWTFLYTLREGETGDSEGRAIVCGANCAYVTGTVQTKHDDTDILTMKIDTISKSNGKLAWVDRYSSPEHDCDRAFSECLGSQDNLFVAGETYVPPHFSDQEGWHLTLIQYDKWGKRIWVRRSAMITQNENNVQVLGDLHGGCFIAGTELRDGRRGAMVMRYDASGRLLWHRSLFEGSGTIFTRLAVNAEGGVYLCGTENRGVSRADANNAWLVVKFSSDGDIRWIRTEDGSAHGLNLPTRLAIDSGGNVIVAGVFSALSAQPTKGPGMQLAIQKYGADGSRIWQRLVKESGPSVVLGAMSINLAGDILLGGTERRSDTSWEVVQAKYDALGNQLQFRRYPTPQGYVSAALKSLSLADNGESTLIAEITPRFSGDELRLQSATVVTHFASDGAVRDNWLFEPAHDSVSVVRDLVQESYLDITGQTGPLYGPRKLMVLHY